MADTDIQRKRKYDTAFDEALLKHYDRPRVLALTKDEWTAELDKEEVEIGLYDLLTSLVFMTHGTFEATKFADEHTPYSTRYNGDREELDIEIEKKDGEVEVVDIETAKGRAFVAAWRTFGSDSLLTSAKQMIFYTAIASLKSGSTM